MKLNGLLRLQLTKEWMKRGCEGKPEDFIKMVCQVKNIEYIPLKEKKDER